MGKGGRSRCKNSCAVERQLGRELAPYSKERRSFLCSVATAGAESAGSAILSLTAEAQRKEASFDSYATIAAASFAALHVNRQSGRLLFAGHQRTPKYMPGALRYWTDGPGHFTPLNLRLLSTMLSPVITTVEAVLEQLSYQNKSVLLGRVLHEPAILITTTCHIGRNIPRSAEQRCSSIARAQCATIRKAKD